MNTTSGLSMHRRLSGLPAMKIGFDAKRLFHNFTGLGNYSRSLVDHVQRFYPEHDYYLFTPSIRRRTETLPFLDTSRFRICTAERALPAWWRSVGVRRDIARHQIDVYHGLSNELPQVPIPTRTIVTIHDLIFKKRPGDYSLIDRWLYDLKSSRACRMADRIVAVSQQTKDDIERYYAIEAEKITRIYQSFNRLFDKAPTAAEMIRVRNAYGLPKHFFVYVGSITPRKNLLYIIRALKDCPKDKRPNVVVVGGGKRYAGQVKSYIRTQKLKPWVHWLGSIDNNDLRSVYGMARALVFPSNEEGFGIPIVEAIAVKTLVIAGDRPALREAGGVVAQYVDIQRPQELTRHLCDDLSPMDETARQGHLAQFGPKTTAAQMMAVYEDLHASTTPA